MRLDRSDSKLRRKTEMKLEQDKTHIFTISIK